MNRPWKLAVAIVLFNALSFVSMLSTRSMLDYGPREALRGMFLFVWVAGDSILGLILLVILLRDERNRTTALRALGPTRRRRVATAMAGGAATILVVTGSILGLRTILRVSDRVPDPSERIQTVDGVTLTFPGAWSLVPCEQMSPEPRCYGEGAPAFVLSNQHITSTDLGCPNDDGTFSETVFLAVQNQQLAGEGPSSVSWPVEPRRVDVDDVCFVGWSFFTAGWTAAERTFHGFAGVAPGASGADRAELFDSFASMSFGASTHPGEPEALATGIVGGRTWRLVLSQSDAPLSLDLYSGQGSTGFGFSAPSQQRPIELAWRVLGRGQEPVAVIFGAGVRDAIRVRVAGRGDEARIIELGPESDFNAFVLEIAVPLDVEIIVQVDAQYGAIARVPLTLDRRIGTSRATSKAGAA